MASSDRARRLGPRELPPDTDLLAFLLTLPPEAQEEWVRRLGFTEADAFDRDWPTWAHDGQQVPPKCSDGSDWSTCVVMGGRGFGKTRAGSEWIVSLIREQRGQPGDSLSGCPLAVPIPQQQGDSQIDCPPHPRASPSLARPSPRRGG